MDKIRLNKYLSEMGICSRREADRLTEMGKVTVDGVTATVGMRVDGTEEIICDGKPAGRKAADRPKHVLLAVHKPAGVVCTTTDRFRKNEMNIVDMIKYPSRVYPVGRLDKDSEGLILMTNNGDMVNKILRAGNAHEKEYLVTVDQPFNQAFLTKMSEGVEITDKDNKKKVTTLPCVTEAVGKKEFRIILTQGLNRQIRKMCETLGYHVIRLVRVRIMNIRLGNLNEGGYRKVTPEELEELNELLAESSNASYKENQSE